MNFKIPKIRTDPTNMGVGKKIIVLILLIIYLITISVSATDFDSVAVNINFRTGVDIVIDNVTVFEGNTAEFTIELSSPSNSEITIDYVTVDGSASSILEDYEPTSGTVTFSPGETAKTVSVPTLTDDVEEVSENFFVDLSNATGPATIADPRGIGTILDAGGGSTSIAINDDEEYEGDTETFTVQLSGTADEMIQLGYETVDVTASAADDYIPTSGILTFLPGQTEKTIEVQTLEDDVEDPDETFEVQLDIVSGENVGFEDDTGLGTILERTEAGGGGGEAGEACTPLCPPVIPLVEAKKSDELQNDLNENGAVDPGDVVEYRTILRKRSSGNVGDLVYVDPLSPHLKFLSLSTSVGVGNLKKVNGQNVVYVEFSRDGGDTEELSFPLEIRFRVKVKKSIPEGLDKISGQATIYFDNVPTTVTDDPDTINVDDPTYTKIVTDKKPSKATDKPAEELLVEKEVLEIRSRKKGPPTVNSAAGGASNASDKARSKPGGRLINPGNWVQFEIRIENPRKTTVKGIDLIDEIDSHLEFQADSLRLNGDSVDVNKPGKTRLISLDLPPLGPRETMKVSYWAKVEEQVHPDLGYIGTNAYVQGSNITTVYSDDPDTELFEDRTALLLPTHCDENNYLGKWELWLERLKNTQMTIVPVLMPAGRGRSSGRSPTAGQAGTAVDEDEINKSEVNEELNWVLVGNTTKRFSSLLSQADSAGAGGAETSEEYLGSIYRKFPRYALIGAGELNIGSDVKNLFVGLQLNKSLAGGAGGSNNRRSVYIQKDTNRPLYDRVSSTGLQRLGIVDKTGFSNLCDREYLPYIMNINLFDTTTSSINGIIDLFRVVAVND